MFKPCDVFPVTGLSFQILHIVPVFLVGKENMMNIHKLLVSKAINMITTVSESNKYIRNYFDFFFSCSMDWN